MSRKLRVLHVIQNLNYGGMERLLADIVRRTDRTRFDVHVLCLDYLGRFADGLGRVAGLHLLGPQPRWSMLWPRALTAGIRAIAPDVVHSHSGVWYKVSLAARRAGVHRILHTDHGRPHPDPRLGRVVDGLASRRTDVVVAVSGPLARSLRRGIVAASTPVRVIPNGIDTDRFRPRPDDGELRRELGLAPDAPVVGSIGRLEAVKGYDVMVEAFARLRAAWPSPPEPVLVVAGEGAERAALERLAERHRLGGSVFLLGWRDDAHSLLSAFSLFTLASRSEGTSISLLEAMSSGLRPVVTRVGGNAVVLGAELRDGLVPAGDADRLAAAWRAVLLRPDHARREGLAARHRVRRLFGLEATVRAYERLYAGAET